MASQDRRYQYDQYRQDDYFRDSRRDRWQRDSGPDDEDRRYGRSDRDYRDAFSGYGQGRDVYPRYGFDERNSQRESFGPGDYGREDYRGEDERRRRGDLGWRRQSENFYGERGQGGNDRGFQNREPYRVGYPSFGGYGQGRGEDFGRNERGYERRFDDEQDRRPFWDRASDEVSSWFGDEDAARRRRSDEARDQYARYGGVGPKNYKRSDDRIREDVSDRLSEDPYVNAEDIEVTVASGEITLTGAADDRDQRRRAEIVAERVTGVSHVQNNLRVKDRQAGRYGQATQQGAATQSGSSSGQQAQYGSGSQHNLGSSQQAQSSSAAKQS